MLCLSRKKGQTIVIKVGGELVRVRVLAIRGDKVILGIAASEWVEVDREEVYDSKQKERSRE